MKNNVNHTIWTVFFGIMLTLVLAGCRNEEYGSPDETYRAYYAKVIEGRSFDEEVEYHANSRRHEIQESLINRAENSNQSVNKIKALYLNFTQQLAKCGSLSLSEERIEGDVASLTYAVLDTCTGNRNTQLVVQMVNENGWKILSDVLKVSG